MVMLPEPSTSTPLPAKEILLLESLESAIRKSADREENDEGSPLAGPTLAIFAKVRRLLPSCKLGIRPLRILACPEPVTPAKGSGEFTTLPFILAVPSSVPV